MPSTAPTSDEQLLALLQSPVTQERGFRLLVQEHQERLYWHIRRMVTDHEDANDVLQNTFVKVFRYIAQFEGKSSLYTWLYRIATNEAISFLNQQKRKQSTSLEDGDGLLAQQLRADSYFDGDQAQVRLQQALRLLPEKQRAVFNLRYFEEMSYQDMSEVLETSVGALKASFHHAVKKIEHYFKEYEG